MTGTVQYGQDYSSHGVIYRVTVESPEHATYEFTSWSHLDPYRAAMLFYTDLSSECARITEQHVRKTEARTIVTRGYGNSNGDKTEASK